MTELVTFAASSEDVAIAVAAGADHLVLEDSKLAVRCYSDDFSIAGFDRYRALAEQARALRSDIRLSVNMDKLIHDRHRTLVAQAAAAVRAAKIDTVRVQEPGIGLLLQQHGDFQIHLASETGYNNQLAVATCLRNDQLSMQRQVLSNDWTAAAISDLRQALRDDDINAELEFQVHGPVLLQYTDRRLMAGHAVKTGAATGTADELPLLRQRRTVVEGRSYPMYDNMHGNFMYAGFDKSLYRHLDQLIDCRLDAWLVDTRGESLTYAGQVLEVYRRALDSGAVSEADDEALRAVARRPLKPGFFIANNTDYVFEEAVQDHAGREILAHVIDSIKQQSLVLRTAQDLDCGSYELLTPEGKTRRISVHAAQDMQGNRYGEQIPAGSLAKIKWQKGIYVDCAVLAP